jgi:hypothetical protein
MNITSNFLRGLVDDPRVDGGPVDDPRKTYLRGPVDDPRDAGGLVDDPRILSFRGLIDDPRQRNIDPQEFPQDQQEFPRDQSLSLKALTIVLHSPLTLKSFRRGIG